jgi:hypothetical protein
MILAAALTLTWVDALVVTLIAIVVCLVSRRL